MVFYFVQRGETLYAIARRYQTTVHAIVSANRLDDPNALYPGQALIIPRPGEVPSPPPGGTVHLVRQNETVFHLADKYGTTAQEILKANQVAHPEFVLPGQQLVIPETVEIGEEWPMYGRTPGRVAAIPLSLAGVPLPGWQYIPRKPVGILPSAPVVRYERVYVGLGDGHFYSIDRRSGRVKWRIPASGAMPEEGQGSDPMPTPAIWDGLAYLCSPDGTTFAVDAYSGEQIWRVSSDGPVSSSPAAFGGLIIWASHTGTVCAVEAKTGAVAWKQALTGPVYVPVACGDDLIFCHEADGVLWALDAQSGEVRWKAEAPGQAMPVFAEVAVIAGHIAFDPRTGEQLWRRTEVGPVAPVVRADQVIYPTCTLDLFSGRETEAGPEGFDGGAGFAVVHAATDELVLGVDHEQRLQGWDPEADSPAWTCDLEAGTAQRLAVAPGQIIITLSDGSLRTFRMKAD